MKKTILLLAAITVLFGCRKTPVDNSENTNTYTKCICVLVSKGAVIDTISKSPVNQNVSGMQAEVTCAYGDSTVSDTSYINCNTYVH